MVDVFISYKREERDRCERIYRKLTALGLEVWFDAQLTSGERFRREITTAVNAAKAVLVLWSPASIESDWVLDEAGVGQRRKVLVAAQIAACDIPIGFGQTHYEKLHNAAFDDHDTEWLKILERIGALTGRPRLKGFSEVLG